MNILAVGDIVGQIGIKELQKKLQKIKQEYNVDFVIVNGENAAEGMGITEKNFKDILSAGADCVTMGNHTWGKKEIFNFIDNPKLIRPANYPEGVCGKGYNIYNCKNKKIAVINAIGRAEINIMTDNPFTVTKKIVQNIKNEADIIILDFHAEATAEKKAMGYNLDGEITAMFGTHTHVQTADEQILEKGTGFITDIGMTGPKNSVIGMDKEAALKRFITSLPEKYRIATGDAIFNSVLFEINDETNKVEKIVRINN
jgi:metallophosphoesterase (TIGR00282 family)